MKSKLTIILGLLVAGIVPLSAAGQKADTLRCGYDHSITWSQVATPAALMATGTAISFIPSVHTKIDFELHRWLQADGHERMELEDYVQYTPIASVVVLKACGLETRHGWRDIVCLGAGSALISTAFCNLAKYTFKAERPYDGVYNSFPSGHTITAFFGAEMLRRELGGEYPGIAVAGYVVATGVGLMRMYNNRHWASDVLAGAGIGILSTSLMYWLAPYLRF